MKIFIKFSLVFLFMLFFSSLAYSLSSSSYSCVSQGFMNSILGNTNITMSGNLDIVGYLSAQQLCVPGTSNCISSWGEVNLSSADSIPGIQNYTDHVCPSGQVAIGRMQNGTWNCTTDQTGAAAGGSGKLGVGYLYNDSSSMYLNESYLNATVDDRDTDTTISNCSVDQSCENIWYDTNISDGTPPLENVGNPGASKTFTMGTNTLEFSFNNPGSNGFEIQSIGAYSGDLFHLHQHTGNPSYVVLAKLEAEDADVLPLNISGSHHDAIEINYGNITISQGGLFASDWSNVSIAQSQVNDLSLFTPNAINVSTSFGGEVSGTYDAITLDNTALDDQYYDITNPEGFFNSDANSSFSNSSWDLSKIPASTHVNISSYNLTNVQCIAFDGGGSICSG